MRLEQIAQIAHEANRVYRASIGEEAGEAWDALTLSEKITAALGVQAAAAPVAAP
jgi:hypothetical protein